MPLLLLITPPSILLLSNEAVARLGLEGERPRPRSGGTRPSRGPRARARERCVEKPGGQRGPYARGHLFCVSRWLAAIWPACARSAFERRGDGHQAFPTKCQRGPPLRIMLWSPYLPYNARARRSSCDADCAYIFQRPREGAMTVERTESRHLLLGRSRKRTRQEPPPQNRLERPKTPRALLDVRSPCSSILDPLEEVATP